MANDITMSQDRVNNDFMIGLKKAMPIALGYFPVSFTFGIMATSGGIHPLMATFISFSNVTSAGQFAGTSLIIAQAPLIEIAMTTFVINIRYMLMSLALSQKIKKMCLWKKLIIAFGITDETFALASLEEEKISFKKMLGLITGPIMGWGLGTFCGAYACELLSTSLQNAMGIALYAMFLAIVIPEVRKNKEVCIAVSLAIIISLFGYYVPFMAVLSEGWKIILTTIVASGVAAALFPREERCDV